MTAATRAVELATWPMSSRRPVMSAAPARMIGLRTTMYAIVKKVATPPRTSVRMSEPRSSIREVTGEPRRLHGRVLPLLANVCIPGRASADFGRDHDQ